MISIGWAVVISIVSGGLGMLCMALVACGGQADDCERCAFRRWKDGEV